MIIGIILKNFKCYKGLHYIPLTNAGMSNYCGLIGLNGVGKSAILEALDCFFNNREWNKNVEAQDGIDNSYVMPIFLVDKFRNDERQRFASRYSDAVKKYIKNIPDNIDFEQKKVLEDIQKHLESLNIGNKLLIPIGKNKDRFIPDDLLKNVFDSIEEVPYIELTEKDQNKRRYLTIQIHLFSILNSIIEGYTYIYVPKDIIPEQFIKFETQEIQKLLGTNLVEIIQKQFPDQSIKEISANLKKFLDDLSSKLPEYEFKTKNQRREPNLKADDIYQSIAKDFFAKRTLFKKRGKNKLPLSQLSSGEKQQAIISFIYSIINNYRDNNVFLIIAFDEPETSFHISNRFEQFNKLYEISTKCRQVLFTSHWYGFIPAIPDGCVVNIIKNIDKYEFNILNIYNYREQISINQQKANKERRDYPIDIWLKGKSDLVQSIVCSLISDDYYNWLICEGTSDKIYLEEYLKDEIKNKRLRIISACTSSEVENLFKLLSLSLADLNDRIKGKVFLLVDTDKMISKPAKQKEIKRISYKRIINQDLDNNKKTIYDTILTDKDGTLVSPKTDIEDTLNGKVFNIILNKFKAEYPELLDFINEKPISETASYWAMQLNTMEYQKLDDFFNQKTVKGRFARAYVNELTDEKGNDKGYKVPDWITEIKKFFNS